MGDNLLRDRLKSILRSRYCASEADYAVATANEPQAKDYSSIFDILSRPSASEGHEQPVHMHAVAGIVTSKEQNSHVGMCRWPARSENFIGTKNEQH